MYAGLIQSVDDLKSKDRGPLDRKQFCIQTAFGIETATSISAGISILLACLADFGHVRPYNGEPIPENKSLSFFFLCLSINPICAVPLEHPDQHRDKRATEKCDYFT